MIILDHEQGSDEWFMSRLGIATGSMFNCVMTTKQMKRAKSDYIYLLAAEAITQKPQEEQFNTKDIERGNELESCAVAMYELDYDCEVTIAGLCKPDINSMYGVSPDGLIGQDGGLEIKCPRLKKHLQYINDGVLPPEYAHQVYGSLFTTGRDYWDFMSYSEDYRPFYFRTNKDDESYKKWAEAFEPVLNEFLNDLKNIIEG
jgi:hypothetical protein